MDEKTRVRVGSIQNHLDMLELMQSRNSAWVIERNGDPVRQAHKKIMGLIQQTTNEYVALLELYRENSENSKS